MKEISNQTFTDLANAINSTIDSLFAKYPPEFTDTYTEYYDGVANISLGYDVSDEESKSAFVESAMELMSTVLHSVFTSYGFEGDEDATKEIASTTAQDELKADLKAIDTVVSTLLHSQRRHQ